MLFVYLNQAILIKLAQQIMKQKNNYQMKKTITPISIVLLLSNFNLTTKKQKL
jgi:hypothetical protein